MDILNLFGDVIASGLERKRNQLKGIPTTETERLTTELANKRLKQELATNPETLQEQLQKLRAYSDLTQDARLQGGRVDARIAGEMLPVRGAIQQQNDNSYITRGKFDTTRDIELLRTKANLAKENFVLPSQQQEMALANLDAARQDRFIQYAQGENTADRELMKQQIANNKTLGLINSILGLGAFAAAMAS